MKRINFPNTLTAKQRNVILETSKPKKKNLLRSTIAPSRLFIRAYFLHVELPLYTVKTLAFK